MMTLRIDPRGTRPTRTLAVGVLGMLLLVGVACGGDERTGTGEGPEQARPTSTVAGDGATRSPDALPRENLNNRATPLGRLCWVHREISQAKADLLMTVMTDAEFDIEQTPAEASVIHRSVVERFKTALDELPPSASLPEEVVAFREALDQAVRQGLAILSGWPEPATLAPRTEVVGEVLDVVNPEVFPGAVSYARAAEADSKSCPSGV